MANVNLNTIEGIEHRLYEIKAAMGVLKRHRDDYDPAAYKRFRGVLQTERDQLVSRLAEKKGNA